MLDIPNYQITTNIYQSTHSHIYRGHRLDDNLPVIFKQLRPLSPSPKAVARFRQEYEITRQFDHPNIIKVYDLIHTNNQWLMILEDFSATAVNHLIPPNGLPLATFFPLATQIAAILDHIHQQQLIHKDINPANIVWNQQTGTLKLIDFGISTQLSRQNVSFRNPDTLEGTLAYMSPEQTGRMNRAVDYRTDFYALGITFYQLLTGRLPFTETDPLALVHSHIAQQPPPPHHHADHIPPLLSQIILKLMAKDAENRYQSALGLTYDLNQCQQQWQNQQFPATFTLGQQDFSDRFHIPDKLYGRTPQQTTLLNSAQRIANGPAEIIFLAGPAGIGKSALVQELYKPLTPQHGYFIAGKYDQLGRNLPYAALIQAFHNLINQLLTENETQRQRWRQQLLTTLGPNAQIMVDILPALTELIGPTPPVPPLPPQENLNRFNYTFLNFIHVFTQQAHPLVIFLDDLQWADPASLQLLTWLTADTDSQHLLIIGAYRDNEINAGHPLKLTIKQIQQTNLTCHQLTLNPLTLNDIKQLLADTLHLTLGHLTDLAELIHQKTNGNPFFVRAFLTRLHQDELLFFDRDNGRWNWHSATIQTQAITDNVVELMSHQVRQLPATTQTILQIAACVGNRFELNLVAAVAQQPERDVAIALWPALQTGLIIPLNDNYKWAELDIDGLSQTLQISYKFAHDRIQQAVYALLPTSQRPQIHYQLGHHLRQQEADTIRLVDQFNAALPLITAPAQKIDLAQLNLTAGRQARAAAAYNTAYTYLQHGLSLLPPNAWTDHYDLALALHEAAAEAAYLTAHVDEMSQLTANIHTHSRDLFDEINAYDIEILGYISQNNRLKAVDIGLQVLDKLGLTFPQKRHRGHVIIGLLRNKYHLRGHTPDSLRHHPPMTDPTQLAILQTINRIGSTVYVIDKDLAPLIIFESVNRFVQWGHTAYAAYAYASYAAILCGALNDITTGTKFAHLGLHILDDYDAYDGKVRALFTIYQLIWHWHRPLAEVPPKLLEVYQTSLETGDLEFAAHCARVYCYDIYLLGHPLPTITAEMTKYDKIIAQLHQQGTLQIHRIWHQTVDNLTNPELDHPHQLTGPIYNEIERVPIHEQANDHLAFINLHLNKMILCYLFAHYDDAQKYATLARTRLSSMTGFPSVPLFFFYDTLIRFIFWNAGSLTTQLKNRRVISQNRKKMAHWAQHAPMNYQFNVVLMAAEYARVTGDDQTARQNYDHAISLAQDAQNLAQHALAAELAGRFYLQPAQPKVAQLYLREAFDTYQLWGAEAKVAQLERLYPQYVQTAVNTPTTITTLNPTSTHTSHAAQLDIASFVKASQTISGEIILDNLLQRLLQIVLENAGAGRGLLLMPHDGHYQLMAQATLDHTDLFTTSPQEPTADHLPLTLLQYVIRTQQNVVLADASIPNQFSTDPYLIANQPKSILGLPLLNQAKLTGILYLENNLTRDAFTPRRLEILNLLSTQAATALENAYLYQEQIDLTQAYSRFVPQEILHFLGKEKITQLSLGEQTEAEMAVLFGDVRNFTHLSEQMTPTQTFDFINDLLSQIGPIVRQNNGFIDKYMGDSIMALFPQTADDAVRAAIQMHTSLHQFNQQQQKHQAEPIRIGLGLHTGRLMLGTIGEAERMEGTVIADTVNTASRIEGLTKRYEISLLISGQILNQLTTPEQYHYRFIDKVQVKGKLEVVDIYEIFDGDPPKIKTSKQNTKADFETGALAYHQANFEQTIHHMTTVLAQYPDDRPAQIYHQQAQHHLRMGITPDWDSVTRMEHK
ncbi:MAG TPA: AAA family ATPase [Anaerolineae bacterium]|nr:AAA family ATPase [Anaerolineae bacterium]